MIHADRAADAALRPVPTFDAVFVEEYPKMVAIAAAVSGSRRHAEDIAQEAMSRLSRNWSKVQGYDAPGAWLRRVTINLATSQRRKLVNEAKVALRLERREVSLAAEPPEDAAIWSAVATLPKQQRAAIALRYLEDRSIEEIADILDIAPATVRVHLHRARATLRERLDAEDRP